MAEPIPAHDPIEGDEDDKIEVEIPHYPDECSLDEQRRAFVLDCLTQCGDAPSIDGRVFVGNLDLVNSWLKDGTVPAAKRKLQAV